MRLSSSFTLVILALAALPASAAPKNWNIQYSPPPSKPYAPPTFVAKRPIDFHSELEMTTCTGAKCTVWPRGRIVTQGNHDGVVFACGYHRRFTIPTAALQTAGVQVNLPAFNTSKLPIGPATADELVQRLTKPNQLARRLFHYDRDDVRAAIAAGKTVVLQLGAEPSVGTVYEWDPLTNAQKPPVHRMVPDTLRHTRGKTAGFIVLGIYKGPDAREWSVNLYDPSSGMIVRDWADDLRYKFERGAVIE